MENTRHSYQRFVAPPFFSPFFLILLTFDCLLLVLSNLKDFALKLGLRRILERERDFVVKNLRIRSSEEILWQPLVISSHQGTRTQLTGRVAHNKPPHQ